MAVVVAVSAATCWLATGAHRGWTQTSVAERTVDEVTGLEAGTYQQRFVMGVELLAGAWLCAGTLAGLSYLFQNKQKQTTNTQ
jgi:hypothetical protein